MCKQTATGEITRAEAITAAIRLYELTGKICAHLGLQTSAALFHVPRAVFDDVIDYQNDVNEEGILVIHGLRNPLWMKHSAHNVAIYTLQPPDEPQE